MTELVPFQEKRKKMFPATTKPLAAVSEELDKHFKKYYPNYSFGPAPVSVNDTVKRIGTQKLPNDFDFTTFATLVANVTSPSLLDEKGTFTLTRLELPQQAIAILAKRIENSPKRPYLLLPKPYQKMLKRVYLRKSTLESLSVFLESKKLARKYLRILHKRLGIYTKKKPPFTSQHS